MVKQEPGADGAQEAACEREGRRRRGDMGEVQEEAGTELEVQLLRANAEALAFALQGMERERAMAEQLLQRERMIAEELLQTKVQVAELRADMRLKTPRSRPTTIFCRARTR
jgi:hypothetical protein